MEIVVFLAAEGLLLYTAKEMKREIEIIQRWKSGKLSYDQILGLQKYKAYLLRKLNRKVQIGKNPGLFKKDD